MSEGFTEKRRSERYDTEVKIYFSLAFDLETKVEYRLLDKEKGGLEAGKHSAVSRNISVEGLCFISPHKLETGDKLIMDVYIPKSNKPIMMQGEVRWCQPVGDGKTAPEQYRTGILIEMVNGQPVKGTIHYDEKYKIKWSLVLESVLGSYRILSQERAK